MLNNILYLYRKMRFWPAACRYYPSCSYYAEEAICRYGFLYGSYLALLRIFRCNQWFPGGYDPVL